MMREAGGLVIVQDATELTRWVGEMLRDHGRCRAMADAAAASVQRHAELPRRTATALLELLPARPA
jgi:hypothetical protein